MSGLPAHGVRTPLLALNFEAPHMGPLLQLYGRDVDGTAIAANKGLTDRARTYLLRGAHDGTVPDYTGCGWVTTNSKRGIAKAVKDNRPDGLLENTLYTRSGIPQFSARRFAQTTTHGVLGISQWGIDRPLSHPQPLPENLQGNNLGLYLGPQGVLWEVTLPTAENLRQTELLERHSTAIASVLMFVKMLSRTPDLRRVSFEIQQQEKRDYHSKGTYDDTLITSLKEGKPIVVRVRDEKTEPTGEKQWSIHYIRVQPDGSAEFLDMDLSGFEDIPIGERIGMTLPENIQSISFQGRLSYVGKESSFISVEYFSNGEVDDFFAGEPSVVVSQNRIPGLKFERKIAELMQRIGAATGWSQERTTAP